MRKKRYDPIPVDQPKPRSGHYQFQGSKCTHDNRPKRLRTRNARFRDWIKDQE